MFFRLAGSTRFFEINLFFDSSKEIQQKHQASFLSFWWRQRGQREHKKTPTRTHAAAHDARIIIILVCAYLYIYPSSCLIFVFKLSVPEYILTLKIDSTALVLALVLRGYSHTLNLTNPKYFCWNIFLARCFFWFGLLRLLVVCLSTNKIFSRITNLTIQTRTTVLQNKHSYPNAVRRSINASSTPWIILINESRLRLHS